MASAQLRRLQRRLDAVPQAVKDAVKPALERSGQELVGQMQNLAPEDSGDLKRSIVMTPGGSSTPAYSQPGGSMVVAENAVAITAGNKDVRYPHLVEYGTTDTEAQPYFWPAFRLMRRRLQNRIKRSISKAVREGWTK
jgi:HK97 gp10 family phage protein